MFVYCSCLHANCWNQSLTSLLFYYAFNAVINIFEAMSSAANLSNLFIKKNKCGGITPEGCQCMLHSNLQINCSLCPIRQFGIHAIFHGVQLCFLMWSNPIWNLTCTTSSNFLHLFGLSSLGFAQPSAHQTPAPITYSSPDFVSPLILSSLLPSASVRRRGPTWNVTHPCSPELLQHFASL